MWGIIRLLPRMRLEAATEPPAVDPRRGAWAQRGASPSLARAAAELALRCGCGIAHRPSAPAHPSWSGMNRGRVFVHFSGEGNGHCHRPGKMNKNPSPVHPASPRSTKVSESRRGARNCPAFGPSALRVRAVAETRGKGGCLGGPQRRAVSLLVREAKLGSPSRRRWRCRRRRWSGRPSGRAWRGSRAWWRRRWHAFRQGCRRRWMAR